MFTKLKTFKLLKGEYKYILKSKTINFKHFPTEREKKHESLIFINSDRSLA